MTSVVPISRAEVPGQQQLVDYVNALASVSAWSLSVTSLTLPPLTNPPDGYASFAAALVPAKVDALSWSTSIVPQFSAAAASMNGLSPAMASEFAALQTALAALQANPGDTSAAQIASAALTTLSRCGESSVAAVSQLVGMITTLRSHMASDAATLDGFAAIAASGEGSDAASIASCTAAVAALQGMISNESKIMTLQKLANWDMNLFLAAAGIAISVALIPAGAGAGILIPGILGLAGATVTSFVPVTQTMDFTDQMKVQQDEIYAINVQIGDLNSQIALLQTAASQVGALSSDTEGVAADLTTVANFWFTLQSSLTEMNATLTQASADFAASDYAAAAANAQSAAADWDEVMQFTALVGGITLNAAPGIQTMPLPPGASIG